MPNGWIKFKSLHCKSKAFDDVCDSNNYSCRKSSHCVKDVIDTRIGKQDPMLRRLKSCRTESQLNPPARTRRSKSVRASDALTELPDGHPSRNVVEIIFQSSWSSDQFPGRIEMIYKVENGLRTVNRFEEYREVVKSRCGVNGECAGTCEEDARCLADGNEMMRFYPLPDGINGGAWAFTGGKGQAVCTFSGSGEAHASIGSGGGRRAMLICRVIAGRVANRIGFGSDSVAGRDGELYVFDTRAVYLFMHDPRENHFKALKRIIRYLKGTITLGLQLTKSPIHSLVASTDADRAGCPSTRRSTSGYCIFLGNNIVSWSSKRQATISRSSAEVEYRGVANVVAEITWLCNFFNELKVPLTKATFVIATTSRRSTCHLIQFSIKRQSTSKLIFILSERRWRLITYGSLMFFLIFSMLTYSQRVSHYNYSPTSEPVSPFDYLRWDCRRVLDKIAQYLLCCKKI